MSLRIPLLISAIILLVLGFVLIFGFAFFVEGIILIVLALIQGGAALAPRLRRILLFLSILCAVIALVLVLMGVNFILFGFVPAIILTLIGLGLFNALMSSAIFTIYYRVR